MFKNCVCDSCGGAYSTNSDYYPNLCENCRVINNPPEERVNLTEEEKVLLLCAFDMEGAHCENCIIGDRCGSDGGIGSNGFSLMGRELLKKLGVIED